MKIGFIGTGNMGRILIEAFCEAKVSTPSSLFITNRTIQKAYAIKRKYPEIHVCTSSIEVVHQSDFIFLCVKPLDIHPLLKELKTCLQEHQCLISITSPISVEQIESAVPCQVARVIPSITNRAKAGAALLTFGNRCSEHTRNIILSMFEKISKPILIENNITRVASDIVSCGPAFFSFLLQKFIEAAAAETDISKEDAVQLANEMMIGIGKLLESGYYTLPTLQEKVHVKGGVTGEGIKVLENELGDMFHHLFQSTHAKFDEDLQKVRHQFDNE
ncbi:late competence protein ComER [Aeribacillus sp. FSL K6-1121]|uniref:late competence protein ComER n=1 Tax=Aeribacillus sp. FSL K6-1121 TaxID=2954745 RepID=UPI0030F871B9